MQIEKNVPVPNVQTKKVYPYKAMQVGDSFYVPGVRLATVLNTNWRWGKRLGWKFMARVEGEGVRVWRVE